MIKEAKMGRTYSTQREDEKYIQNFSCQNFREENTWEILAQM